LPPVDDWIVFGVSLIPYGVGKYFKKKKTKTFGQGMTAYAIAMLVRNTIIRTMYHVIPATPPPVENAAARYVTA